MSVIVVPPITLHRHPPGPQGGRPGLAKANDVGGLHVRLDSESREALKVSLGLLRGLGIRLTQSEFVRWALRAMAFQLSTDKCTPEGAPLVHRNSDNL